MDDKHIIYECGICGGVHRWEWDGDCRDMSESYADAEDYASVHELSVYEIEVKSWDERIEEDALRYRGNQSFM